MSEIRSSSAILVGIAITFTLLLGSGAFS